MDILVSYLLHQPSRESDFLNVDLRSKNKIGSSEHVTYDQKRKKYERRIISLLKCCEKTDCETFCSAFSINARDMYLLQYYHPASIISDEDFWNEINHMTHKQIGVGPFYFKKIVTVYTSNKIEGYSNVYLKNYFTE